MLWVWPIRHHTLLFICLNYKRIKTDTNSHSGVVGVASDGVRGWLMVGEGGATNGAGNAESNNVTYKEKK